MTEARSSSAATLDREEVRQFDRIAAEWWDANGKFRPLHQIGPARIEYARDRIAEHFGRTIKGMRPLAGLSLVDIGCGGGLVAEPMSRLGAEVTGLDPSAETIRAAERHAAAGGLPIAYRQGLAEDLAAEGARFDVVLCLEVVEHVPDVGQFVKLLSGLLAPGGLMVLSTINRTVKAYALAIVGAEYVLRWLPVGTHKWERFVTPDELARHLEVAGLAMSEPTGVVYSPLTDTWRLDRDTD
ncbi:MAG TPA: bifunctional 2-polyprenyl-6-hydroxyphenol methylase/3-demethylubiquinol 3-O-methyltransferase UbiG, partial [Hyphomicrobiaceae bacterium]|nr:bifunctional 2-polyprenyl-6-hydroxyphenol methylase/3-demethylubiquinol 3-O-methyltransferase UbiG [Hyphomicrobiaceae bacterium]